MVDVRSCIRSPRLPGQDHHPSTYVFVYKYTRTYVRTWIYKQLNTMAIIITVLYPCVSSGVNYSAGVNDLDMMSSLTVAQKILVTNNSKLS